MSIFAHFFFLRWYSYKGMSLSGQMRCLAALAHWEELINLCNKYWQSADATAKLEMAPMVDFLFQILSEFQKLWLNISNNDICRLLMQHGTWETGIGWKNMFQS